MRNENPNNKPNNYSMKNFKFMAIALMAVAFLASCEKKGEEHLNVATFENISVPEVGYTTYSQDGVYQWTSGDFGFSTGLGYEGTYYYNYVVSNQTSADFKDYTDQYHSASGGAVAGNNFAVAFQDNFSEGASLDIKYSNVINYIPGTYVNNNAYAVYAIRNGYTPARKFKEDDYFLLTFQGYFGKAKMGTVEFYLADYRNGKSLVVTNWTYVDLTALGVVDRITCTLTSTDNGDYGMNTPGYFCLDNFGAKK